ncbi:Metallo-peptidase family M12B Reprolysin-like [Austwickia chelonae]|uniref:Peptidase M11 gametolysin domain-containing protein n=1 Tax=Austwickia chelonae NBRC 105200 TaxID=1184607 RepID=K6VIS7_9MICO|nr:hypothetical protein [Austwickia chelonae]GAB76634.1 hypothetical protein AUCHE_01_01960 [Austwickia chelonae NBRC 105200]SEW28457.1 Metallo-peptidase family M12B Reprolysin-like [Austwickia chelonae]
MKVGRGRSVAVACTMAALVASGSGVQLASAADGSTVTVQGELVTVVDGPSTQSRVRVPGGAFVPVSAAVVKDVEPGAKVSVTVPRRTIERSGTSFTPVPDAVAPVKAVQPPVSSAQMSPAVHQVTAVSAVPRGVSGSAPTAAAVQAQIASVSQYWSEQTGGALTFSAASVNGPLALSSSCSDVWSMWEEAASRSGFTPGPNKHLVLVLPKEASNAGCGYGLASVGSGVSAGGYAYVSDTAWPVMSHELGHNLGLAHAQRLTCPGAADVALAEVSAKGCRIDEYGDPWDVMAASAPNNAGSLSAPQAHRLGLWPSSAVTELSSGTTSVSLNPVSSFSGTRAVRVVDPKSGAVYFVEYRTRTGRDYLLYSNMVGGVRVVREDSSKSGQAKPSLALDASPSGSSGDVNWGIPVGGSFTSYGGGVTVQVISQGASSAQVKVTAGAVNPSPVQSPAPSPVSVTKPAETFDLTPSTGRVSRLGAGGWFAVPSSAYMFNSALVTYTSGASWSTTVDGGRSMDIIGTAFPGGARGRVLVDGVAWADFDSYRTSSSAPYQQVLRTVNIPAGRHTVTIVALPSAGRGTLALDAYRLR